MTMLNQIKEIKFNQPKLVNTKNGRMYVQSAELPKGFWEVWKLHKDQIKKMGISPSKFNGQWKLNRWSIADEEEIETEKEEIKNVDFNSDILFDYQKDHAKQLILSLMNNQAGLDASDTGTGKTYVALAVAKHLNLIPIVLTPKSVIPSWHKASKVFDLNAYVLNYEKFRTGKDKYLSKKGKEFNWNLDPEKHILIFDEVHRCKNHKTQNSAMLRAAKKAEIKTLSLSATIADNPLQLYSLGLSLGVFNDFREFWRWAYSRGCTKGTWGVEFHSSKEHLDNIHKDIFPKKGSRIAIKNLGDAFPDNLVISDCYDMNSKAKDIQAIYNTMNDELNFLKESKEKDKGASILTEILRARQEVELLKVPTFVEMAEDAIEEGNSVAIFVSFKETVKALSERLKTNCIIDGSITGEARQKNIDAFQNDESRIIICNIRAGGVGISLHDLNGKFARVSLISPTYSAQDLLQALGRIHRAGAKSPAIQKIVFCAGTIEEEISEKVQHKINNIKTINDGDLI